MTEARQNLGRLGEEIVARELAGKGWKVVARNARVEGIRGELDIVAIDGGDLVIVEVKTGREGARSGPECMLEMVGPRKQAKLRQLAGAWASANRGTIPRARGLRIDVIGLRVDWDGQVTEWQHVSGAC